MPSYNTRRRGRSLNRKNKFRKTQRNSTNKARSEEPRREENNSKEIGSGSFGIVSRPPARCNSFYNKNFNQNAFREAFYNPNYVSKLTTHWSASKEIDIALAIKERIPTYYEYFCLGEFICPAPESKSINRNGDEYDTYIIMPYCGIPFSQIIRNDVIAPMSIFELCYILTALQKLVHGIQLLHMNHIFHNDIHEDNILYDSETYTLRLIDFGLSNTHSDIKNADSTVIIRAELSDMDKFIDNVIRTYTRYILDSRIFRPEIRKTYPSINKFYYQLSDFFFEISRIKNPENQARYHKANLLTRYILTRHNRDLNIINEFKKLKGINYYLEHENNNNNNE